MEKEKKEKLVQIAQIGTVVVYVFLILHSTVGEYVKLMTRPAACRTLFIPG